MSHATLVNMSRRDNTLLPADDELHSILSLEAERTPPHGKMTVHYPDFKAIIKLLEAYGLPTILFSDDTLDIHQVVQRGAKLIDVAVQHILHNLPCSEHVELLNGLYDYLSEEDRPHRSDLIFVFGAKTELRPLKAAELYGQGLAKKILVSGGASIYASNATTEAERYKELLISAGVAASDIVVEDKSITLPDNVRRSLNLCDAISLKPQSLILVNSPYAQRRGWCIFKKYLPDSISLYRVNAATAPRYQKDQWYLQEDSLRVVLNEYIKMRASVVYNSA